MEAWVCAMGFPWHNSPDLGYGYIFCKREAWRSGGSYSPAYSHAGTHLYTFIRKPDDSGYSYVEWADPIKDRLYHFVFTFDNGKGKVYANAMEVASRIFDFTSIHTNSEDLKIGSNAFKGFILLARIYKDYALKPAEVKWNMLNYYNPVHPDKLVLWLPMDEGGGGRVYDKSGNANNGTLLPVNDPPAWTRVRQYEIHASV